jgi:excisionase family DNA binding protein
MNPDTAFYTDNRSGSASSQSFYSAPYLTVGEVAHYLRIPEETIYKYVRTGRIPASKLGKHWRFIRVEIDNWVARQRDKAPRAFRVLVVDDDEFIRKLFSRWLGAAGCETSTAASGQEGLERLRHDPAYDLVSLDLCMPGLDGVETLREIRRMTPDVIVTLVTGDFDGPLMDRALELGPVMAMKKPVTREAYLTMINALIACGKGLEFVRTT